MRSTILAVLVLLAAGAAAQEAPSDSTLDVDSTLSLGSTPQPFGRAGTRYWGVLGGSAFAMGPDDSSTDYNAAFTYHYFLLDDFEIIGELGAWYFAQDGDDAAGVNPGFTLRWHFLNRQTWTLYADTGIGLLFATDNVPATGTSIDFMPRAGGGVTFRFNDRGLRGYFGARWHHVSNAQINGGGRNPDRNGVALYAGVMFPF